MQYNLQFKERKKEVFFNSLKRCTISWRETRAERCVRVIPSLVVLVPHWLWWGLGGRYIGAKLQNPFQLWDTNIKGAARSTASDTPPFSVLSVWPVFLQMRRDAHRGKRGPMSSACRICHPLQRYASISFSVEKIIADFFILPFHV